MRIPLLSENIGPALGLHDLGAIDGPGWYNFVGEKAGGKSTHLRLLRGLKGKLDALAGPLGASISEGETFARLQVGESSVTFRRSVGGSTEVVRDRVADAPTLEEMPNPIGTLVDPGIIDPKARGIARLKGLLTLAPLPAEAHLGELLKGLESPDLAFADLTDAEIEAVARLAAKAQTRGRAVVVPLRDAEALRNALTGEDWSGKSILDAASTLADALNKAGNTCEHASGAQRTTLDGAAAVLESTWSRLPQGRAERPTIAEVRSVAGGPAPTNGLVGLAREKLAGLRASMTAAEEEEARREGLRGQLAAMVVPDLALLRSESAEAEAEAEAAKQLEDGLLLAAYNAKQAASDAAGSALVEHAAAKQAIEELALRAVAVSSLFGKVPERDHGADLDQVEHWLTKARTADATHLAANLEKAAAHAVNVDAQREAEAAGERRELCDTESERAAKAVATAEKIHAERADLETSLAAPIDRPTPERLEEAAKAIADFEAQAALYAYSKEVAAASLTREEAGKLLERVDTLGAAYRAAAKAVWGRLGGLVTLHLRLPYLAVEGSDLFIGFGPDGTLNRTETGWLDEAAAKNLADGSGLGLNLERFIAERVQVAGEVEWRHVDDVAGISAGELREAFLTLLFDRATGQGAWIEVPWGITAAFDEATLRSLARRAVDSQLTILSERPRRAGDPEDLVLEKIEPAEGGVA